MKYIFTITLLFPFMLNAMQETQSSTNYVPIRPVFIEVYMRLRNKNNVPLSHESTIYKLTENDTLEIVNCGLKAANATTYIYCPNTPTLKLDTNQIVLKWAITFGLRSIESQPLTIALNTSQPIQIENEFNLEISTSSDVRQFQTYQKNQ